MAKEISVKTKIAIIGAGHMGTALYEGLIRSGVKKTHLMLSKRNKNKKAARFADVIFLSVKPGVVDEVLKEIQMEVKNKAVVSVAAGISLSALKKHASGARVGRVMPNIAIASGEGVVGLLYGSLSSKEKVELKKLMSGLGLLVEAKNDAELDVLTLISGCGPGIVAFFIDALAENARRLGIKGAGGEQVAFQVFKGTIAHMENNKISATNLAQSVATKGGVTEMILETLTKKGFKKNLSGALAQGHKRIRKIAK